MRKRYQGQESEVQLLGAITRTYRTWGRRTSMGTMCFILKIISWQKGGGGNPRSSILIKTLGHQYQWAELAAFDGALDNFAYRYTLLLFRSLCVCHAFGLYTPYSILGFGYTPPRRVLCMYSPARKEPPELSRGNLPVAASINGAHWSIVW